MMEKYLQSYSKLTTNIIYSFNYGQGGLGDYIKFFTLANSKKIIMIVESGFARMAARINNIPIETLF